MHTYLDTDHEQRIVRGVDEDGPHSFLGVLVNNGHFAGVEIEGETNTQVSETHNVSAEVAHFKDFLASHIGILIKLSGFQPNLPSAVSITF